MIFHSGSSQNPSNLEVAVSTIALNYTIVFREQGKEELEEASFRPTKFLVFVQSTLGSGLVDRSAPYS